MGKLDCKITQDLLSNYVENLTSAETNEFIENHLKECKECAKMAKVMKKGLTAEENKTKHQIDYLKKYKRKMLILKTVISLVIVLVLILLGIKFYQWQFLSRIYDKNVEYEIGNNYKLTTRDGSTGDTFEEVYKDGSGYVELEGGNTIWQDKTSKYIILGDNRGYIQVDKNAPPASIDSKVTIKTYNLFNNIENKNELIKLVLSKGIKINEEEYGKYQCYVILCEGEKIWIDKESLFIIRADYQGKTTEYFLEINTITDNDVQLPNLADYEKVN